MVGIRKIMAVLALVGGAVHVLAPLGVNVLAMIPFGNIVQLVAGVSIVVLTYKTVF